MTIWLNHQYEVPGDIFGSVQETAINSRAADAEGNLIYDLDFDMVVNDANPRALDTWQAIKDGVKLGVSIGALLKDYVLNKDGTFDILDVELLEASIVGIPANPRSWIQNAVFVAKTRDRREKLTTAGVLTTNGGSTTPTILNSPAITPIATLELELEEEPEEPEESETPEDEPVEDGATSDDVDQSDIDAVPTESVTAEVGEAEPPEAQEAPNTESESEPENADGLQDEAADGEDDLLGDEVTEQLSAAKSVTELVEVLRTTTHELVEARAVNSRLSTERDLAVKGFFAVKDVLDQVANLPLARKAQGEFSLLRQSYERFSGIYSEEFLKMLEKDHE
jgi:hypothetical protein